MLKSKRWWHVVQVLILLVVGTFVWLMFPPQWAGPEDEPLPPKGAKRSCTITHDKHDVPHIKAETLSSAFYCWGLTHAADRGWQLDYLRRLGRGRVAEHYGAGKKNAHVKRDFFMRLLAFEEIAAAWVLDLKRNKPKQYKLFQYYVWGINDGFHKLRHKKPRHPAYKKYGFRLEPWRVTDSMIVLLLQSFSMTQMSFTNDLKHARLRLQLGSKRYQQLYGPDMGTSPLDRSILRPGEHPAIPPRRTRAGKASQNTHAATTRTKALSKAQRLKQLAMLEAMLKQLPKLGTDHPEAVGSNNWVVAPKLTRNGYPLLANDTHMAITTPNFWHEAHITTKKIDVTGFAVPGLPAIVLGHNRHLAWGLTAGQNNAADVMLISPDARGRFKMDGLTQRLHKIRPVVWVRKGPLHIPIFWKTFARSKLGPILPLPTAKASQRFLMRWVTYHIKSAPLDMMNLMHTHTVKAADKHLKRMTLPNLSAVFADTKGNIGFRQYGLVAKRLRGVHGLLDTKDPSHRWQGFLSTDAMPHVINPRRGYVVTSNNRPFPASYPYFIGHAYATGMRAGRIASILTLSKKHTVATMKQIQVDTLVPMATHILSTLLQKLEQKAPSPPFSSLEKQAISALKGWHKRATTDAVGATVFRVWVEALRVRLFIFDRVKRPDGKYDYPGALGLLRAVQGNIPLYTQRTLEQELRLSLQDAVKTIQRSLGKDIKKWTWGRAHKVHFFSLMGKSSKMRPAAQGKDGDLSTVNVGHHSRSFPYKNDYSASVRLIVELGPQIQSYSALAGQQKNHDPKKLSAEHKRWLKGQFRKRNFTPKDIEANKRSTVRVTY